MHTHSCIYACKNNNQIRGYQLENGRNLRRVQGGRESLEGRNGVGEVMSFSFNEGRIYFSSCVQRVNSNEPLALLLLTSSKAEHHGGGSIPYMRLSPLVPNKSKESDTEQDVYFQIIPSVSFVYLNILTVCQFPIIPLNSETING